jgi:ABC-type transport system involved in cytochrome bd biosynthesis fused ATPase/permease subunit
VSEKQLFGLLVRVLGVLVFLDGLKVLWFTLTQWVFAGAALQAAGYTFATPTLAYGVLAMALGMTMTRWPEWLVRLAWLEKLPTI